MHHSDLPAPIRARVHDSAIARVTRFFNATLSDVFAELAQNARRSGARQLDIVTEAMPDAGIRVTATDDGAGIDDPAVLLSFGETGWDSATVHREDAAGMGVYALARRGCTVSSRWRGAGGHPVPGWRIELTPAHFLGEAAAPALPDDNAPYPHGTAVAFMAMETLETVKAALEGAAIHYPLPVTFNGEVLRRAAFLDGAVHAETWRGIVFGVFQDRHAGYNQPDLNFHGRTIPVRLPRVEAVDGGPPDRVRGRSWSVRADVDACPELELVLPARHEAVETPFLEEMRRSARLAIYRAMAAAEPAPRVAWTDWKQAADAGIDLPVPPAELRPWRPGIADVDDWREAPPFAPVGADALVMAIDPDPQDAQAFHRATCRAGLDGQLFEGDTRFEGYGWYDALARVRNIRTDIEAACVTHALDALRAAADASSDATTAPGFPHTLARPDAIHMHLDVMRGDGPPESITVPADLAFAGEGWIWVAEARPLVTRDSNLAPAELAQLLRAGFFSPSDDTDADAWETQRTRFDEEAMHIAVKLLCSEDEARRRTIAEAVWREILWVIPRHRTVAITVSGGKVSVDLGPEVPAGAGAAA